MEDTQDRFFESEIALFLIGSSHMRDRRIITLVEQPLTHRKHYAINLKQCRTTQMFGVDGWMLLDELKALIERYENYQNHKIITPQQKMFDLTMINLYKLGNKGSSVIAEVYLNDIQGLSKMDLLKSLKEAVQRGFIKDISSHEGRRWILTKDGIRYVESLTDEINKK